MKTLVPTTLLVVLALGLGVWVGGALLGGGGAPADDDHDHAHGAAPAAPTGKLDPRTLANLGVRIDRLEPVVHVTTVDVLAEVVARPDSFTQLTSWFGGRVETVHVAPGGIARPGEPLVTLLRDPVERPALVFTGELLAPGSERLHETVAELHGARERLSSAERELGRLRALDRPDAEVRVVQRQRLIDLEREVAIERRGVEALHGELARHGLTEAEIEAVMGGSSPPPGPTLWRRALTQAGLWGAHAQAVAEALPASRGDRPWTVALIGEMSAAGVPLDAVAAAIAATPDLGRHFEVAATLLLAGQSVEQVVRMAEAGALAPRHTLSVPPETTELDVVAVHVQPGATIEAGAPLVQLVDPSTMWLRVDPLGGEVAAVTDALSEARALSARPVVAGTGPEIDGFRLRFLRGDDDADGVHAIAQVENRLLATGPDGERTWALRAGTAYSVLLPSQRFEQVFVLEPSGVATSGPARLVFIQDGPTFRAAPVRVLHEDADVAVVAADGAFHTGDPVVVSGALALSQALQTGGAVDPHAGHSH